MLKYDMVNHLYKNILFLIMKSSILVGGQAVIEGVMMRVPGAYATAVRKPNGTIVTDYHTFNSMIEKYKILSFPILRGITHLYESMKIGYGTLQWSAEASESEEASMNKYLDSLLSLLSFVFAIGLFFALPIISADYIQKNLQLSNDSFLFNVISGITRITLFLTYLISISFLDDVKRLFQFHGAEHKTVYNFESGKSINVKNAQNFNKEHPRCGTSFVFIVMLVSIFSFTVIDSFLIFLDVNLTVFNRIIYHIPCIPIVAGFSYEILKLIAKYQHLGLFKFLAFPGLLLQKITTQNPDDTQLEVAIKALKVAFGEKLSDYEGKEFNADAIG